MLPRPHRSGALHEAQEWLTRAERDLQAARNELNARPPLPEMTAFHVQQAAEKVLKAFLTARSISFPYTHDLVVLQAQCEGAEPGFDRFLAAAQTLNPYATQFRYPGGPLSPSEAEAQRALELGSGIVDFVREQLQSQSGSD